MDNIGNQVQFSIYQTSLTDIPYPHLISIEEWEKKAQSKLSPPAFDYVHGGAGCGETMQKNRDAFTKWSIIPRMWRNVEQRSLQINLFQNNLPAPLLLAPIGVQSIVHDEGELASARAAASLHIPYIASTASSYTLEEIANVMGNSVRWFQLYWSKDEELVKSFISRAEKSGYSAIVITLDTPMMAWREKDLQHAHLPFLHGKGIANYLADPIFLSHLKKPPKEDMPSAIALWSRLFGDATLTFERLKLIRESTRLPILLKGILHPDDAELAIQNGANGIIVSNHGGRQVDGTIATLDALPPVLAAVNHRVPVLLDSGIRRGSDILKAIALGASAVLLGRPYIYGLAVSGEEGVRAVVRHLLADLDLTMGLAGYRAIQEISNDCLLVKN
ncbi:alpha-hydroxy-acid oxidizing protein [Alicyclobacillus tolerans]|uniref:L-lactate oxidase n=1 Tax=Alicyclobacillus tolerans TaxID=90970 RepID=A0ABT9LVN3_9BACL|nr:alpha-hydroxy-acid oxidizing protein [Alicyclobacillus tengchongensis]MDP9728328.1 L-lactate dehydrogenase (cytochrome) [Alicyclobacillus tengchongensis]